MLAQVHQRDQRTLVRRQLAPPVTLTEDDQHRYRLYEGVWQVECGRIRNQRGSPATEMRCQIPPSTAWEPRPFCRYGPTTDVTRSVATLKKLRQSPAHTRSAQRRSAR
ncbi:hypothetical protein GCM10010346_63630 [Streptomyces chryseus]|uniref:Transposase n=1 Tax=Streptomyces chryseus TaxID=68186 RepID=A0ABQ3EDH5_9ACTN|nr:hypothetical protein GCM10010346_63630 [Streptomyces chryseus]